jgi:hypothetical protein
MKANLGGNVSFDCVIKGFDLNQLIRMYDDLEFEWLKDDTPFKNLNAMKNFNLLELSNLSREDFGKYSCQVRNSKSKITSNVAYGSIELLELSTTKTTSLSTTTTATTSTSTTTKTSTIYTTTTSPIIETTNLEPISFSSIISSTAKSILKSITSLISPSSDKNVIHIDKDSIVYIEEGSNLEIVCDLDSKNKVKFFLEEFKEMNL